MRQRPARAALIRAFCAAGSRICPHGAARRSDYISTTPLTTYRIHARRPASSVIEGRLRRRSGLAKQSCKSRAQNVPRERDWLFDIVKWELPKTVGRGAATSVVLIPRRAHADDIPRIRTRVRIAARVGWGSTCARVTRKFAQTKPSGEHAGDRRTNLRLHEMTAGVISLFPACYLWVLQLTRAGRIETLKILPARCRCHHELAVERLSPCQANRGGRIRRCSSCDSSIGTHGFSCDGGCAAAGKPSRSL